MEISLPESDFMPGCPWHARQASSCLEGLVCGCAASGRGKITAKRSRGSAAIEAIGRTGCWDRFLTSANTSRKLRGEDESDRLLQAQVAQYLRIFFFRR